MTQTHYCACNLCEAICGLEIRHENGEIVSIRGDPDDPLSRGHICPKAVALQDIYNDPDRQDGYAMGAAKFQELYEPDEGYVSELCSASPDSGRATALSSSACSSTQCRTLRVLDAEADPRVYAGWWARALLLASTVGQRRFLSAPWP